MLIIFKVYKYKGFYLYYFGHPLCLYVFCYMICSIVFLLLIWSGAHFFTYKWFCGNTDDMGIRSCCEFQFFLRFWCKINPSVKLTSFYSLFCSIASTVRRADGIKYIFLLCVQPINYGVSSRRATHISQKMQD